MVRKIAEEKTMVRIYGEADDTFGVFDEGEKFARATYVARVLWTRANEFAKRLPQDLSKNLATHLSKNLVYRLIKHLIFAT